jgi:hypothetical protein
VKEKKTEREAAINRRGQQRDKLYKSGHMKSNCENDMHWVDDEIRVAGSRYTDKVISLIAKSQ